MNRWDRWIGLLDAARDWSRVRGGIIAATRQRGKWPENAAADLAQAEDALEAAIKEMDGSAIATPAVGGDNNV